MSRNNVEIDTKQLDRIFDTLNDETQKTILLKGLKKGGDTLKKNTEETMLQKVPFASYAKGKANITMAEGVNVRTNKDYCEVKISIRGNYLNVFFEMGTDERYRKLRGVKPNSKTYRKDNTKSGYTGKVEGYHFFKSARENSDDEMINEIENVVRKEINKLFK